MQSGIDAGHFNWPPANDPNRPPYRGLKPLEADDAGIFFGRDAAVVGALDSLRGSRDAAPPRLLVILGASGAGKSSFLRAGLVPRLARDDRNFHVLPIVRPGRAAISGETGLLHALEGAFEAAKIATARADLRAVMDGGAGTLRPLLQNLADKVTPAIVDTATKSRPSTLVVAIDQGEELFLAEGQDEARTFLALLRDLLADDAPSVIALFAIRSDNYERLQLAKELDGVKQVTLSLPPMPKGAYAEVIKGPANRLYGTARALKVDNALVDALLTDIEAGGAKDSLPLLAFTLERLYGEYRGGGHLKAEHYNRLGGIAGSIEAAIEQAFTVADADPKIPRDRQARLALLRRGLIPWVAGIDPDTGAPRRRVARLSEIPAEARPLMDLLVDQRLLATDVANDTGEKTVEPAHEALLRQWGLLQGWLKEDAGMLSVMDGVKRASRDWAANAKSATWLTHTTDRLKAAERLLERADLTAHLEPTDRDYLAACREAERAAVEKERSTERTRQRLRAAVGLLMVGVIMGLIGWINQSYLLERWNWFTVMRPYMQANVRPYALKAEEERALMPLASFRECAETCPEMIVAPAGEFIMGSPATENGRDDSEGPQHKVTIAQPFAVSRFDVTFADWDACVSVGGCPEVGDSGWGRGTKPVINVSWNQAQQYVAWFSKMTGQPYRLLTEAEWEYVARAGTTTAYYWGDEIGKRNANCVGCGSEWDNMQTSPVGSFKPNAFGLHDMAGNVWQWAEDCYHDRYEDETSRDGSERTTGDCYGRVLRGGSLAFSPQDLRAARRNFGTPGVRSNFIGFRLARTLRVPAASSSAAKP
jgi:formylglycine-generating enzyme required for sulfatase activity